MAAFDKNLAATAIWQMPTGKRVVVALVAAATVPTFVLGFATLLPGVLQTGTGIGSFLAKLAFWMLAGLTSMIPAILIGGLLYGVIASKVRRDSVWLLLLCLLAGGFAAIPMDIWIGLKDFIGSESETRFSSGDSGGDIYLNSKRTAYGWRRYAENTAKAFACGMLGGLIFWWIARPKRHAEPSSNEFGGPRTPLGVSAEPGTNHRLSSDRS